MKREHVLIRTYSAGVHFGELIERNGNEVKLANSRRIWRWRGANTLSEIANNGISKEYSRVAEAVPTHTVLGVIEILPLSDKALASLSECGWSE